MAAISRLLKRFWVLTMVIVALLAAAAVVSRLRSFFDSDKPYVAAPLPADTIEPINTKTVTYEIVGPQYASGRVSYLDVNGKTMEASFTTLPWSVTVSTTDPGCWPTSSPRATPRHWAAESLVNDKLVAEDYAEGRDAQAFCLTKRHERARQQLTHVRPRTIRRLAVPIILIWVAFTAAANLLVPRSRRSAWPTPSRCRRRTPRR